MKNNEVLNLISYFANSRSATSNKNVSVDVKEVDTKVHCITVPGSAFVIRHNDKISVTGNCHVSFMSHLIKEEFDLSDESDKSILRDTIMEATEQEIKWGKEIYGNRILGISEESTEAYVKFLGNKLGKVCGLGILYKGFTTDPYAYLSQAKRENFFETKVTEYSQSTAIGGWDF